MSKKFYQAQKVQKPIEGFQFEATETLCGVLWGIYATEDPEQIEKLDALVKNPKAGVYSLTEQEYIGQSQKKMSSTSDSPPRPVVLPQPPPQASLPEVSNAAGASEAPAVPGQAETPEPAGLAESEMEAALAPQPVEPSPTAPPRNSGGRRGKRGQESAEANEPAESNQTQ